MSRFVQLPPADYSRSAFAAFSPQQAGFDLDDARAMMWMSQLAYETDAPETIAEIAPLWGFKPVQLVYAQGPVIDTRAIIGEPAGLHGGSVRGHRSGAGEKPDHRRAGSIDG